MSLYEFPPIGPSNRPICLQEVNGGLVYGNAEELQEIEGNQLLGDYPEIGEQLLSALQHSLTRDSVRETFVNTEPGWFQQAVISWTNKGISNLVDCVGNAISGNSWLTSAGRVVRKAQADITSVFAESEESLQDCIAKTSSTLDWRTNWVRCIAVHSSGHRIAVCQSNDYVSLFCPSADRSPVTLRHQRQRNVTDMAWKPYDRMVLAVACSHAVLIWRLDKHNLNVRPSVNCAEVIELSSFSPVTQCLWDSVFDQALFIVSASSSHLQVLDTGNGESETVGSWSGGRIRHLWISPDGCKFAVAYDANFISVYDRYSWNEERWKKLNGPCTAAAWTPLSDVLFFATRDEHFIRCIHFVKKLRNMGNDQPSFGSENAIPVFDVSEVEMENSDKSRTYKVGGSVQDMKISPDGQRVAITFNSNPAIVALFVVETIPAFFFAPCGLINGGNFGAATILSFFPKFRYGSLLAVAWSAGKLQYIPLFYGHHASEGIRLSKTKKQKRLAEISAEELLVRESMRSTNNDQNQSNEPIRSRSRESVREHSATSSCHMNDFKLFSSTGLYDQLSRKSAEKTGFTVD